MRHITRADAAHRICFERESANGGAAEADIVCVRRSVKLRDECGNEARRQVFVKQQFHGVATSLACSRSAA